MDEAYQQGYDAFVKGRPIEENPYQDDPQKRDRWETGWEDAKIDRDSDRGSICVERKD